MDNPARLRPVMNLTPSASKPQKKLERPSIKVFEEDVDMELENERKSSLNAADQEAVAAIETSTSLAVETSTPTVNTPTLSTTAPKQHAVDKDSSRKETETTTEKTADTVEAPRTSDDVPVPYLQQHSK
ncbi:hypothetical protein G6F42_028452 [Rhizopus arrhizus]|nr:hypothetical protein G6F42_028452 [Rhizopus arrhizus]